MDVVFIHFHLEFIFAKDDEIRDLEGIELHVVDEFRLGRHGCGAGL